MALNIDAIPDSIADSEVDVQAPLNPADQARFEQMARALESAKGLRLRLPDAKSAAAIRFRLYRTRRRAQAMGITALDDILIKLDGPCVLILSPPKAIEEEI